MDAAEQIPHATTEPLPWMEICIRYPDQYVCLVDVDLITTSAAAANENADPAAPFTRRERLGGILNYYYRRAA